MKVLTVPVRKDNYAYVLVDEATKEAAAVDPYDVDKVKAVADGSGLKFTAVITTHHHNDHDGGNSVRSNQLIVPIQADSQATHLF